MTQQMEMLARYQEIRQIGLHLNNQLTSTLSKEEINEGGRKLGILRKNTLVLDSEDEIVVLMDFCLHDVWHGGMNAIERFLKVSPPPADSDEMLILQSKRGARYSLFAVTALAQGVGVHVRDLLYNEDVFLTDLGFSRTAEVGLVMAFRLLTTDGINMTSGAALPLTVVPSDALEDFSREFVKRFKKMAPPGCTPQQRSEFAAALIRACLRQDGASRIRYMEPGEDFREHRPPEQAKPRVTAAKVRIANPNKRCSCGSGRKFKNCCGSQHRP